MKEFTEERFGGDHRFSDGNKTDNTSIIYKNGSIFNFDKLVVAHFQFTAINSRGHGATLVLLLGTCQSAEYVNVQT